MTLLSILLLIALILGLVYSWMIRWIYLKWCAVEPWQIPKGYAPKRRVCIAVAARNEEQNIQKLLDSLLLQDYPKNLLEIIVVDDYSTDQTAEVVRQIESEQVQLLQLSDLNSGDEQNGSKKLAIQSAIAHTNADIIITTDADCVVNRSWVSCLVSYMEKHTYAYITAPIRIEPCETALHYYQALEMLGMNALTAFGIQTHKIILSNAANSCFTKSLFDRLEGFSEIDDIPSGDDVLFLRKVFAENPQHIGYCKSNAAIVSTMPLSGFSSLIHQRVRWASKYNRIAGKYTKIIMGFILFYLFSMLVSLLVAVAGYPYYLLIFGALLLFKLRADHWYLNNLSREFERPKWMRHFYKAFLIYPIVVLWTGLKSIFKPKFLWKNRKF